MENKPNEDKIELQTYEQPAEPLDLKEPEWMKILKPLIDKYTLSQKSERRIFIDAGG